MLINLIYQLHFQVIMHHLFQYNSQIYFIINLLIIILFKKIIYSDFTFYFKLYYHLLFINSIFQNLFIIFTFYFKLY